MAAKTETKTVKMWVPKVPDGEEQVLFVGVNGKGYRVQRGKTVEVPEEVAEVLKNAQLAEELRDEYIEGNQSIPENK